jgi:hypothetical protein
MNIPRQYSLVRVEDWYKEHLVKGGNAKHPLAKGDLFVFLGEIPNMPGHCVVIDHSTGKVYSGFHIENFHEVKPEEI